MRGAITPLPNTSLWHGSYLTKRTLIQLVFIAEFTVRRETVERQI